jgi:peptide/nickel transport system substrate-binding protein
MNKNRFIKPVVFLFILILSFACSQPSLVTPTSFPTGTPIPSPTSMPEPRVLNICLGEDPNSLYPLGRPNAAARSVLSAIYDGPIDIVNYQAQPAILEKLPSLKDGDAVIEPVVVSKGTEIVDASGLPVTLKQGVKVHPSGCRSDDCAIAYDGITELKMDQMVVTFQLKQGLTWSDGQPLTAVDSVYTYSLVSDPSSPGSRYLAERTRTYEAADDLTVQWWGKPGYVDPNYATNFFMPTPRHVWSSFKAADLPQTDAAARAPLGWGPYVLTGWEPGAAITLQKNPNYFRADEGLPKFDTLNFRIVPDPDTAISDLLAGKCDLLDPSMRLDGDLGLLREMAASGQLKLQTANTVVMEMLAFGIRPSSYDDGYYVSASGSGDRPDLLGDKRTRQAIAMCLDRQKVVDSVLYGLSAVPNSFIPSDSPEYPSGLKTYEFNVTGAKQLLEQVGWKDTDGDPSTPRVAAGVARVPDGTPLVLNYITTNAAQRRQAAEIYRQSLSQCGIQIDVQFLSSPDLYAAGPAGPLFGRKFDLAAFAMGLSDQIPPCTWYNSQAIPSGTNDWIGTNVSGYSNADFDRACLAAQASVPEDTSYQSNIASMNALFAEELPVLPLYQRLNIAATRPDFCGFSLGSFQSADLWNIENFDLGLQCGQ